MMDDNTWLIRNPQAITADVGGDVIFLHEGEGQYYSLSDVGALAWNVLASSRTFGSVVEAVLCEYDAAESQVRRDLEQFFTELEAKGLIRVETEPGP